MDENWQSILQEALVHPVESLSSYVHVCLVSTLERLLLLLSLILNAYVCILFVKTWRWPQKQKKLDDEMHLQRIQQFIQGHSKVLTSTDLDEDNKEEIPYWRVPKAGHENAPSEDRKQARDQETSCTANDDTTCCSSNHDDDNNNNLRSVPGECAICFQDYCTGDKIIWSSNPNCVHCYHAECLRQWLLPWRDRNRLCPCCRLPYCHQKLQ
ncbi:NADPH Oxidase [Seminavis robusta]|uniref:NADPH Oxidase n=1 Tax=Seminavis robusta TaxID=568900 RepID=A0A9N8ET24_9STRA|nr:NADPH Oxidase [Seminavis robusta]|eukprot:Sro1881_g303270.1 NADPH Oxidase (211) ;mRNA; f:3370-4111